MSDSLGNRLREERRRLGLNQEKFGAIGSVHRNSQADYESDRVAPDTNYLVRLAEAGVDVIYVVTGQRAAENISLSEAQMLDAFRTLSPARQELVRLLILELVPPERPTRALHDPASAAYRTPPAEHG